MKLLFVLLITFMPAFANAIAKVPSQPNPDLEKAKQVIAQAREEVLKVKDNDHMVGEKSAPVVMIEYSSLGCPHCQKFHSDTFNILKSSYIDTGKLLYVYRQYPTNRAALAASKLVECSGDAKFFIMLHALFESQVTWAYSNKYMDGLLNVAKLSGMSEAQFNSCQNDLELEKKILGPVMQASNALKISGTPFFIINGDSIEGEKPTQYFKDMIDSKLKR